MGLLTRQYFIDMFQKWLQLPTGRRVCFSGFVPTQSISHQVRVSAKKVVNLVKAQDQRYSPDVRNGDFYGFIPTHATTASSNGWSTKRIKIFSNILCGSCCNQHHGASVPAYPRRDVFEVRSIGRLCPACGRSFWPRLYAIVSVLPTFCTSPRSPEFTALSWQSWQRLATFCLSRFAGNRSEKITQLILCPYCG